MFHFKIYQFPKKFFHSLTIKLNKIMATIAELEVKLVDLQSTVDAEQEQIAALLEGQKTTIEGLEAQITELQAMVDAAPTPEQLQAVIDGLEAIKSDISGTV